MTSLLTSREVCLRLNVSRKTLQLLRHRRKIAYVRFGHRSIRFREEAVERFIRLREEAVQFACFSNLETRP